ncbi:MAG: response regulator [Bacteroidales bacterium]|nr:response regulator [Bacteroidales bacterium]
MQKNFKENTFASKKSVLIVEDDYISSLLFQEYLKMENFHVLSALTGKEAVSIVENNRNKIIIVLMDILMPEMNGVEAAKRIKNINHSIPIIAQTSQAYNLKNYDLSFFDSIITKPINFRKLKQIVNKYTSGEKNYRLEMENY